MPPCLSRTGRPAAGAAPVERATAPDRPGTVSYTHLDVYKRQVFIVTVPTPIDEYKRPDLRPLEAASRTVGRTIAQGGVAIFESTVYPGATEEVCVPIIERESGLVFNRDFHAGYSPERINPGDKQHRLETIMKVTSGSTPAAADFVDGLYRSIISAGTHKTCLLYTSRCV